MYTSAVEPKDDTADPGSDAPSAADPESSAPDGGVTDANRSRSEPADETAQPTSGAAFGFPEWLLAWGMQIWI